MLLYNLIVKPIEYLIEVVFTIMNSFLGSEGYAIIAVGLVISTLVLPLYLRGDSIQEIEQKKQEKMERWLAHIRKAFRGDERYMMTNTYYREQGYRPVYALRGVVPILLQIPFFIAAYHFLSHLEKLQGCSFWIIPDLGAEDGMIAFGNFHINLLPILMTVLNMMSALIYTKGYPFKKRLQPFALALVFLLLLYRSPSGLVIYWTVNNLYSLVKNIIMKHSKNPGNVFRAILFIASIIYTIFLICSGKIRDKVLVKDREALLLYLVFSLILCMPLILHLIKKHQGQKNSRNDRRSNGIIVFILESSFTLLWGMVIPFLVIAVAPKDFLALDQSVSPILYAINTTVLSAGVFLIWGSIIYYLADERGKAGYEEILFLLLVVSLINLMFFNAQIGNVSAMLEFDILPHFDLKTKGLNLIIILLVIGIGHILWKHFNKTRKVLESVAVVIFLSLTVMAGKDLTVTAAELRDIEQSTENVEYVLPMSKQGRNVVLIMLDRAISGYVPYIFDEKPELKDSYNGFVYYPNTLSYGTSTETGAQGLYGGYDYSTEAMNLRMEEVSREEQYDDAIMVLPTLFKEAGWDVTVFDPPAVDMETSVNVDMLRENGYRAFQLAGNLPTGYSLEGYRNARYRNFFFYSIYRCMPAMLQDEVYDTGGYLAADRPYFLGELAFRNGYTALSNLGNLTRIMEDDTDYFIDFCNVTTHGGAMLSLPDYDLEHMPDYEGIDVAADKILGDKVCRFDRNNLEFSVGHYHSNMAAYIQLAKWFDQLREWGVYDNTRIIIVSDHGFWMENFDYMTFASGIDVEALNCVLMIKDFSDNAPFHTDESFMCNADTPAIALTNVIEQPINPFTGNPISTEGKADGLDIFWPGGVRYKAEASYDSASEAKWFHVENDIFIEDNWQRIDFNAAEGRP